MNSKKIILALALGAIIAPAAPAQQLDLNITGEIQLGRRQPPPPPEVVVLVPDNGPQRPSPWERGRWYQRQQGYYYYPGVDVYYRPGDRVWFYAERGQWRSGRTLPAWINVDFGRSVTLTMATDRPYAFHQQVVARYPANYFGTRVRVRDDDRRDRGHDRRRHDNDRRGHDDDRRGDDNRGRGRDDRK